MKFIACTPIVKMSGTSKNSQLVYTTVDGEIRGRAKVDPTDPKTSEQKRVRAYMSDISRQWVQLTDMERDAWEVYGYRQMRLKGKPTMSPGLCAYMNANMNRRILDLPLLSAAPQLRPPDPVYVVNQVEGLAADTLGLTLFHSHANPGDYAVTVRMTCATATAARRPQVKDMRYVRGANADSTAALPPSGETVTFTPTRYALKPGQRYGVLVRVVRVTDGVASAPAIVDFRKA